MNATFPRFFRLVVVASGLLLLTSGGASALELKEGLQYKLLKPAQPTDVAPGKVEVVEVFWYACGHCYALEPMVESWNAKGRAPYVQLVRLPATWNELLKTHARVFYTAEILGKLPQLNPLIFRAINVERKRLDTPESIEAFFVANGVSKADFQKAFSSFAVESRLRRAEDLNRRYRITATPTFVVNGKYVTDVSMSGSEDNLFKVLDELAARGTQGG
jgi:thiol:disulfide interchange protein DsbA